jgi:hypothetical protein
MAPLEIEMQPGLPGMDTAMIFSPQILESVKKSKLLEEVRIKEEELIFFGITNNEITHELNVLSKSKHKALLINIEEPINNSGLQQLGEILHDMKPKLAKEAPVLIVGQKGGNFNFDKKCLMSAFWEANFTSPKVYTKDLPQGFFLLEGRRKGDRPYIDLTREDGKNYKYIRGMWGKMMEGYGKNGRKVVNGKESILLARMKKTHYPPGVFSSLKNGFGVNVQGLCGCEYSIGITGKMVNTKNCCTENCLGEPLCSYDEKKRKVEVYKREESFVDTKKTYKLGVETPIEQKCFCGENLVQVYVEQKRLPKGRVLILQDTYCPHDGRTPDIESRFPEKRFKVPLKNIIIE